MATLAGCFRGWVICLLDMSSSPCGDYLAVPSESGVQLLDAKTLHPEKISCCPSPRHVIFVSGGSASKAPAAGSIAGALPSDEAAVIARVVHGPEPAVSADEAFARTAERQITRL